MTLDYDADGNLTGDGLWTYEYDGENRLKRMFTSTAAVSWGAPNRELVFTYDYLGRRVRKQSWLNGSLVSDRKFLYQGWTLIAELDTASNKIVRSYAWGLDLDSSVGGTGGVGGLVLETMHSDTALTAYHVCADGGGNVTALVNQGTGAIAASYEYGPFGENVRTQTFDATLQAQGQPMRFSTKFTDSETGLVYYGRRFYDPGLGRFINRDPIEEAGGNNLYGFCGNNPVNGYDVLGMGFGDWWQKFKDWLNDNGSPNENHSSGGPSLPDAYQPWDEGNPTGGGSFADSNAPTSTDRRSSRIGANYRLNELLSGAPNRIVNTDTVFPGSNYDAVMLVNYGRTLGADMAVTGDSIIADYVRLGQSLGNAPVSVGPGYYDEFGRHETFCMSCHGSSEADRLKMSAARGATEWYVFGVDMATLASGVGEPSEGVMS